MKSVWISLESRLNNELNTCSAFTEKTTGSGGVSKMSIHNSYYGYRWTTSLVLRDVWIRLVFGCIYAMDASHDKYELPFKIKPGLLVRMVVGATESRATRLDTPPACGNNPPFTAWS